MTKSELQIARTPMGQWIVARGDPYQPGSRLLRVFSSREEAEQYVASREARR